MDFFSALLTLPQFAYLALLGFLGLFFGSFFNVVISRLPEMLYREWQANCEALQRETLPEEPQKEAQIAQTTYVAANVFTLSSPRSHCPRCKIPILNRHNVPVLGWLMLKGKCFSCQLPISFRYPSIELLTGLFFAFCGWHWGVSSMLLPALILVSFLLCLTFIDLDTQLLPDNLTQPLLWLGFITNLLFMPDTLGDKILGALFGYLSLWTVNYGFKIVTGKEGMGHGDFKLLAALGAWIGLSLLPVVILFSSLLGLLSSLILLKQTRGEPIPFGPYLSISGWLTFCYGESIWQTYLSYMGLA
ncbi:MAG: A24 family peptidase [Neisseriaceae bacterium]|nr:A24 family peptidase [Neisseriaceae bacterium]